MTTVFVEITTTSPILLCDGPPAGNLNETLEYIPGSTLCGVLAARYLEKLGSASDPNFHKMFLNGDAVFDNARIKGAQVIPLTARTCKYNGGFDRHRVVDLLLSHDATPRCQADQCKAPLDYFQGNYRPCGIDGGKSCEQIDIKRRLITRTAIQNCFGTAATGRLYSQMVIEEGQVFRGAITVESDLKSLLCRLVDSPFDACIGRGRSRGQGWVHINPIGSFEAPLSQASQRAPHFKDKNGRPLLAITLLSDAIFSDEYLRDLTSPTIDHMVAAGIEKNDWLPEPEKAFADTRMVFGFDGFPLRLPRVPRLAVTAGSVFVFKARDGVSSPSCPSGPGEVRIGERMDEGFGRAVLWHPFHLDFRAGKED